MLVSGKDPDDLIKTMNAEMVKVVDWLQINIVLEFDKKKTLHSLQTEKSQGIFICRCNHK